MYFTIDGHKVAQIRLPAADDMDPHPRLIFEGHGIHAGESFTAWLPDGWRDITLEVSWEPEGPGCWYISTPGLGGIVPIGLWCRV